MAHKPERGLVVGLDRFFQLKQRGTTLKIEILGGVTTFATMAYIIVVNLAIQ